MSDRTFSIVTAVLVAVIVVGMFIASHYTPPALPARVDCPSISAPHSGLAGPGGICNCAPDDASRSTEDTLVCSPVTPGQTRLVINLAAPSVCVIGSVDEAPRHGLGRKMLDGHTWVLWLDQFTVRCRSTP